MSVPSSVARTLCLLVSLIQAPPRDPPTLADDCVRSRDRAGMSVPSSHSSPLGLVLASLAPVV